MAELSLPVRPSTAGFEYDVDLEGVTYHLAFTWNPRGEAWHLDILTPAGEPIVQGIPLVTDFPLLQVYRSIVALPPGELLVVDLQGQGDDPGAEDLGTRFLLLYYDSASRAALSAALGGG